MESSTLNKIAYQKPLTAKLSSNLSASKTMHALITSRNNPNVSTVTGKVRITNIGLTKARRKPKTKATSKA